MAVNEHGQSEPLQAENPIVAKMPFGKFNKIQNLFFFCLKKEQLFKVHVEVGHLSIHRPAL